MGRTYASPAAYRAALTQAARNMSAKHGMSVSELMNVFYFNRLTARVFTAEPDGWLIKGGQALLVRYAGSARLSRDIDLQSASPERTVDQAREALLAAAAVDLGGDFLRFAPTKFDGHSEEGRGGAQHFDVYLGSGRVAHIKVDLVVGRTLAGTPETRDLVPAVEIEWPTDWPRVRLYPVIDHVADKVCAMYERHGEQGSNRYRDLADLLLISQQETIDGPAAHQALLREAQRRTSIGILLQLPSSFQTPGPNWTAGYPQQAALVLGLRACRTYEEAAVSAAAFLDPLLDGSVSGHWRPDEARWRES
jgi:hypothetical protein